MVEEYESEVESGVCNRALLVLGVFSIKLRKTQERGYPDRLFLIPNGVPLFIEFKRKNEEPTPYQLMIHERLRHAGYKVEVHDEVEPALRAICKALDTRPRAASGREVVGTKERSCAVLRPRKRQD